MMKNFIAILAVLAISGYAMAAVLPETKTDSTIEHDVPIRLEDVDTDGGIEAVPSRPIVRQRRLTCDVFSFESGVVTPNHSACAVKCIAMGKKGGHCEGTACQCRNDKWVPW